MGASFDCGIFSDQTTPDYTYNMDSQAEHKYLDEIPTGPAAAVLSEQLELFLSCTNLPKLDIMSPSDPFIVLYQKRDKDKQYQEIAKTEMVRDNNNPEFTKPIIIDYHFEEVQFIKLEIYDADNTDLNQLSKHDFIGMCTFVLADLVNQIGSALKMFICDKKGKRTKSSCIIRSEEIKTNHDLFMIQFECKELSKPSWLSRPNPYLQIYRQSNDGVGWMSILRTKRFIKTQNARWNTIKIPIQRLCNADYARPILIVCFHDKDNAEPVEIGQCITSLQALLDEESKPLMKKNVVCGTLLFHNKDIIKRYGFLEYVMGGMNIEMMIGIDFTGSNGDPQTQDSLHYIGAPMYESPYMRAIRSVGRVIEAYDTDKQINAYGFGANINPFGNKNVSHCFNLSLTDNARVNGIEGVLQSYVACLNKIQLYGPTNFAEIIETCASMAVSKANNDKEQNYVILLMVTDGAITDMKQTKDVIVNASSLPLSIIIVGVGDANFDAMDQLDADDEPLVSSGGVRMSRDIVQFVPFNKHKDGNIGLLAKAVLEEVPRQITGYMTMNKLHPILRNVDDMKQQTAALNVYSGPSSMIRSGTEYVQNMQNQPMNPYYPQLKQTPEMVIPQQQQAPLQSAQTEFNSAINPSAPTPSAPLL